jgi:hypothetical protein
MIEWGSFAAVAIASVVSACLFVLCGLVVLFGLFIIIPWDNFF